MGYQMISTSCGGRSGLIRFDFAAIGEETRR
jgi:hypothetical protein